MNRRIEDQQHRDQRRVAKVQARLQPSMRQLETMMMLEEATATTATTVQSQQTVSSTLPRRLASTTRSHLPGESSSSSTAITGRLPTMESKRDTSIVIQSINDLQRPSRHLDTNDMELVHAYLQELLNVTLLNIGCPYHLLQQLQQQQPYNNHTAATCNFNGRGCFRCGLFGHAQRRCPFKSNARQISRNFEFCFMCSMYMGNKNHMARV